MIRYLKVLGLAIVALSAMSVMAAPSALAQTTGVLTVDGPTTLDGVEDGENYFEYPGLGKVKCPESTFVAEKVGGGDLISGESAATVTPSYNNAKCNVGGLKATVTMNKCHFVFRILETTPLFVDKYGVTAELVCAAENEDVEVHVYASASNENIQTCKVTIKPAGNTHITGLDIANETKENGETVVPHVLTVTGEATNIEASKSGLCGAGSTKEAKYKANVTLTGTNSEKEVTPVTITH